MARALLSQMFNFASPRSGWRPIRSRSYNAWRKTRPGQDEKRDALNHWEIRLERLLGLPPAREASPRAAA